MINQKGLFLFGLIFIFFNEKSNAQILRKKQASHATCEGMINITESGRYLLEFIGLENKENETLSAYLKDSVSKNKIWSYFSPKNKGKISFDVLPEQQEIDFFLFETEKSNPCALIKKGQAKKILHNKKLLSKKVVSNEIEVDPKKRYIFLFISKENLKFRVNFKFEFIPIDEKGREIIDRTISDYTVGKRINTHIKIINAETKKPVTSSITIKSKTKLLDGYYQASDLFLFVPKTSKSLIKIDRRGYFSKDIEHKFLMNNDTLLILLKPLTIGSTAQFEEIEFYPGTSAIKKRSEEKVKRVADFLALNASIHIEIQGHVNSKGKNTSSSIMLSKRRAKRVMKRLHQYGINRSRLTAVGFGNAKPIYSNPKKAYQEQANRRVEIMIK